jgi:putative PIN family toxin of toxin-antitoxin system
VIVVVDTNVFVSALLSPKGPPAQLLNAILSDRVRYAFDSRMMDELSEVIRRPKFATRIQAQAASEILASLARLGTLVTPVRYPSPLIDEDDRPFLEVAIACGGLLVTGNVRHFPIEGPVRIVPPGEALGLLGL